MSAGNVEQQFAITPSTKKAQFSFNPPSATTNYCGITGNVDRYCYANI